MFIDIFLLLWLLLLLFLTICQQKLFQPVVMNMDSMGQMLPFQEGITGDLQEK